MTQSYAGQPHCCHELAHNCGALSHESVHLVVIGSDADPCVLTTGVAVGVSQSPMGTTQLCWQPHMGPSSDAGLDYDQWGCHSSNSGACVDGAPNDCQTFGSE